MQIFVEGKKETNGSYRYFLANGTNIPSKIGEMWENKYGMTFAYSQYDKNGGVPKGPIPDGRFGYEDKINIFVINVPDSEVYSLGIPGVKPPIYHDSNGIPHSTPQARDFANRTIAYNEAASNNGNNYPSLDALEWLWNEYQKEGSKNKMDGVKEYIDQWKMGQTQADKIDDIDQLEQLWSDFNNGGYKGCLKPISYKIKELQGLQEAKKPEYKTIEKLKQLKKDYQDGGYLQHALGVEKQVNLMFSENMQKARYIQESQRVLGEDVWSESECVLQAENDKFIHEAYKYHKKDT